jgi:hypothetical protein
MFLIYIISFILLNLGLRVHNDTGGDSMIDYSPLWETLETKGISQYTLMKKGNMDNKNIYTPKRNKNNFGETLHHIRRYTKRHHKVYYSKKRVTRLLLSLIYFIYSLLVSNAYIILSIKYKISLTYNV